MSQYIEIIRSSLSDVICATQYEESLDEDDVINIFDIVFESLRYIDKNWVDQIEYDKFIEILSKFDNHKNPTILKMIEKIKSYHTEQLDECDKNPYWKKFDFFPEIEK